MLLPIKVQFTNKIVTGRILDEFSHSRVVTLNWRCQTGTSNTDNGEHVASLPLNCRLPVMLVCSIEVTVY